MKSIIYLSIIFSLFLFSCKKDHNNQTNNTLHKVSFTVNGFTQSTSPFGIKSNNHIKTNALITDVINPDPSSPDSLNGETYLVYSVYDATGNYVHSVSQSSAQSNFGTITDNLAVGNYTVNIVAYPGILDFENNYNPYFPTGYATQLSSAIITYSDNRQPFIDTFSKTFGITVSTSSAINQAVVLARVNGKLELAITDTVPSNANNIRVVVTNEYLDYSIANSAPDTSGHYGSMEFYSRENVPLAKTNFTLSGIVLNTIHPFSVQITCVDASNNIIASKVVNNVYCEINKTTILSGNLFGSTGTNSFNISINSTWNPIQDTVNFSSIRRITNRVRL